MGYELWDTNSRNLIDWFTSEDEALAFVRQTLNDRDSHVLVNDWLLDMVTSAGETTLIAHGAALIERASALPA